MGVLQEDTARTIGREADAAGLLVARDLEAHRQGVAALERVDVVGRAVERVDGEGADECARRVAVDAEHVDLRRARLRDVEPGLRLPEQRALGGGQVDGERLDRRHVDPRG